MSGLSMQLRETEGAGVLTITGRGETADATRLHALVDQLIEMRKAVIVVDLSGVEFFGSYGVNALVRLDKAMDATGGEVRLAGPRPAIKDLLNRSHLAEKFAIYSDVDEALG